MAALIAQVLPLAVGAAVSPGLLALQMLNLARRRSPMVWAWWVSAGAALVLLAATVAAFIFAFGTGGSGTAPELKGVVKLVAAVVLLAGGGYELSRADAGQAEAAVADDDTASEHVRGPALGLGAALVAPNLALYFPAAHEVAASGESDAGRLLLLAAVFGIAMVPVAAPPIAVAVLGERARPALNALNGFVTAHRRAVTGVLCVVFAIALGVKGAIQL